MPPVFGFNPSIDLANLPDFDFLAQDGTNTAGGGGAYHNNLAFEGDHRDFEDGEPSVPDLFGGFFFGGPSPVGGDLDMEGLGVDGMQTFDGMLTVPAAGDERTAWVTN